MKYLLIVFLGLLYVTSSAQSILYKSNDWNYNLESEDLDVWRTRKSNVELTLQDSKMLSVADDDGFTRVYKVQKTTSTKRFTPKFRGRPIKPFAETEQYTIGDTKRFGFVQITEYKDGRISIMISTRKLNGESMQFWCHSKDFVKGA